MKASAYHLSTTRETPADAEIVSHQLMIRAGMIRKLTAGIYTWSVYVCVCVCVFVCVCVCV